MYVSLRKRPLCNQMSIDEEELIHQNYIFSISRTIES